MVLSKSSPLLPCTHMAYLQASKQSLLKCNSSHLLNVCISLLLQELRCLSVCHI